MRAIFARGIALNPRPTWPARRSALLVPVSVPYAGAVPDGGLIRLRRPRPSAPPSSSGLGHRPFKAAARVRIPLGARAGYGCTARGPVEQLGVLATLSRWRSRVQIPSGPQGSLVRLHWGPSQVR